MAVGVICTWVGNRRFPELRRLARKTWPGVKGRPFRQMITIKMRMTTMTPIAAITQGDWKSS
jgi:hypothetical protein